MKLASIREYIRSDLRNLKKDNLYRKLRTVNNQKGHLTVNGKKIINFNSNDYLGLAANKGLITNSSKDFNEISQCSSRLVGGNSAVFENLENALSMHRNTGASLVYTTGYSAVLGTLSSLADIHTTIFSDELNHASIIDGCRLSGAKIKVFHHNNMEHLSKLLRGVKGKKIVVTEGIFSIKGDMSNLKSICKLAKEFDAFTIIDDAHGDFVFGIHGSGTPSELNVNDLIDVHISSLSKGLGCFGGYVASSKMVREYLINSSRQFIFTSALPTHLCNFAIQAMSIARKGVQQKKLFKNMEIVRNGLMKMGYNIGNSVSQIVPIQIGPEKQAIEFASKLLDRGIFVHPMRFPTVKKGHSVLRLSLSASHTKADLMYTLEELYSLGTKHKLL
jgi:glycine C-acetyltransferase